MFLGRVQIIGRIERVDLRTGVAALVPGDLLAVQIARVLQSFLRSLLPAPRRLEQVRRRRPQLIVSRSALVHQRQRRNIRRWPGVAIDAIKLGANLVDLALTRRHVDTILSNPSTSILTVIPMILQKEARVQHLIGNVVDREMLLPFERVVRVKLLGPLGIIDRVRFAFVETPVGVSALYFQV